MFLVLIIQMAHCETSSLKKYNSVTHILAAVAEPERQPVPSHCSGERSLSHPVDRACPQGWVREVHGWKSQCLVTARVTKQRGALPKLNPKCHVQRWTSMHAQFCSSVDQVSLTFLIPALCMCSLGPTTWGEVAACQNIILNTELKQQKS